MKKKERKISVPVSLDSSQIAYIEQSMKGTNFSEKMRALIERAQREDEALVRYNVEKDTVEVLQKSAVCAYYQTEDEKSWGEIPFTFNKKDGFKKLRAVAESHGFKYQLIENKSTGFLAVYVGKVEPRASCADCIKRVEEAMLECSR